MTVRELVKELMAFNQDATVWLPMNVHGPLKIDSVYCRVHGNGPEVNFVPEVSDVNG